MWATVPSSTPPLPPGLGRVLSVVSQTESLHCGLLVTALPRLVTVKRTSISPPYTAWAGATTEDWICPSTTRPTSRSACGLGST